MFEYEIKSYIDYDILYNNLMQPTEEKKKIIHKMIQQKERI